MNGSRLFGSALLGLTLTGVAVGGCASAREDDEIVQVGDVGHEAAAEAEDGFDATGTLADEGGQAQVSQAQYGCQPTGNGCGLAGSGICCRGNYCNGIICKKKRPRGAVCGTGPQCLSGRCDVTWRGFRCR